jgi:channel protein (hemolysin III family)
MYEIDIYSIPGVREPVSSFSHLLGAAVFSFLSVRLLRRGRGSTARIASLAVLAISSVLLLSISAVFHMLAPGADRDLFLLLDTAGIFALIAGTATPVHVILFQGVGRWGPLLLIWFAAAAGITLRAAFDDVIPPAQVSFVFLGLGWAGIVSAVVIWRRYGFEFMKPLLWGGIAYTIGVVILESAWPVIIPGVVGPHELWHVAVLIGLGLHWKFVFQFAGGAPLRAGAALRAPRANN